MAPAQAQTGDYSQACYNKIATNGLQWSAADSSATAWQPPNITSLCVGAPATDYPIDCFAAAISLGLEWPQAIELCRFNSQSCAYSASLTFGLRFDGNGEYEFSNGFSSAENWRPVINHCAFGAPLQARVTQADPELIAHACGTAVLDTVILDQLGTQNDVLQSCSELSDNLEPARCLSQFAGSDQRVNQLMPAAGGNTTILRTMIVGVCANTLSSEITVECVDRGLASGFAPAIVMEVCRFKQSAEGGARIATNTGGSSDRIERELRTVQGMGNNCVTRNSFNNDATISIGRGWSTCINQPIF